MAKTKTFKVENIVNNGAPLNPIILLGAPGSSAGLYLLPRARESEPRIENDTGGEYSYAHSGQDLEVQGQ